MNIIGKNRRDAATIGSVFTAFGGFIILLLYLCLSELAGIGIIGTFFYIGCTFLVWGIGLLAIAATSQVPNMIDRLTVVIPDGRTKLSNLGAFLLLLWLLGLGAVSEWCPW